MKKILIINGPNLNLLGNREDDIYGKDSLDKIKSDCEKKGIEKKLEIIFFQSNNEGEIIDKIHEVNDKFDGLIINPAAFTHSSQASSLPCRASACWAVMPTGFGPALEPVPRCKSATCLPSTPFA